MFNLKTNLLNEYIIFINTRLVRYVHFAYYNLNLNVLWDLIKFRASLLKILEIISIAAINIIEHFLQKLFVRTNRVFAPSTINLFIRQADLRQF